jgi:hypothetical protein
MIFTVVFDQRKVHARHVHVGTFNTMLLGQSTALSPVDSMSAVSFE